MEHEPLARLIAPAVWGGDIRPFYASMEEIGRVPDGSLIVDAPCGAGVALRGLRPDQRVRYLALDLSPPMLDRARRRAEKRGLRQVEFVEGDAEAIPVDDGSVDLFISYWGLHCFADPRAAIAEAHRCLRAGGRSAARTARLRGSARQPGRVSITRRY
jgi:ubiquinone/menaquinone biosynthesis C-methylase UbiE